MDTISREARSRRQREVRHLRLALDAGHRFGEPSTYSLSARELAAHIRRLRRESWQEWELRVRFGRWAA